MSLFCPEELGGGLWPLTQCRRHGRWTPSIISASSDLAVNAGLCRNTDPSSQVWVNVLVKPSLGSPKKVQNILLDLLRPGSWMISTARKRRGGLADDVELPASSDESVEPLSLSKENEVEEVDPQQPEIQLGDSDEEEYTSDQNESVNEDVNVEFDISLASEDEMENWEEINFLFYTSTTGKRTHDLCTSTTGSRTHDLCTSTIDGLCISIADGEWIYTSSIRAKIYCMIYS
ncbi:hypothetical protein Taro_050747 [Colocasia esculenta]|uniref:Uncharacterized protein n=1 Tax=Colocasia esculenta TaxID=4460 RepID=A0A843XEV3_COLES|nr:hypothetical protein [Colocasia esculenta]